MTADLRLAWTGGMLLLLAACSSDSAAPGVGPGPAAPPPVIDATRLPTQGADSLSTLVSCRAQPVSPASQSIGEKGGSLRIGPHRLIVPEHALKSTVRITGSVVDTNVVAVSLEPAGLQFRIPAILTLNYEGCTIAGNESSLHLAYVVVVDSQPEVAAHLFRDHDRDGDGHDDGNDQQISGLLDHFSRYAVAF